MGRPKKPFSEKYTTEPNTGCWLWTSGWDSDGYGLATGNVKAHRLSYEIAYGPIPKGLSVCHKCDTPPCVNPDHLFLGTNKDNAQDRVMKGRGAAGEKNANARLTDEVAREIVMSSLSNREVAKSIGVCVATVSHVRKGRSWGHVTGRSLSQKAKP